MQPGQPTRSCERIALSGRDSRRRDLVAVLGLVATRFGMASKPCDAIQMAASVLDAFQALRLSVLAGW
ncbi:hypothetical protein Taro_013247 [Colocasia esculenta]|uniref:Uncharacterized protein n=1 Tax=Colocasia esculenta TaxID=4460 RepID=A0A843UF23_COLES|nr:hypothetical protein [Colocasia esculenta]